MISGRWTRTLAVPLLEAPHDVVVLLGDGALGPLPQCSLGDLSCRLDVVPDVIELGKHAL